MNELPLMLFEWGELTPANTEGLRGLRPRWQAGERALVDRMAADGVLKITPLADGLSIRAFSHVGTVRVGSTRITVLPKIRGLELMSLLRYAYRLRDLRLFEEASCAGERAGLLDLLVEQLRREAEELFFRGLHRAYGRREEELESPRGRIDFGRLAARQGSPRATLPCAHFRREEDVLVNQTLLAGLTLAAALTTDLELRVRVRRAAARLREEVTPAPLGSRTWELLQRGKNRLVRHYEPALTLVRLLSSGYGADLQQSAGSAIPLPGFLFDMNRFYQRLLERFLSENLEGWEVLGEQQLKGAIGYLKDWNPRGRAAPLLRPDFIIRKGGTTVALLDAKYRDLWENDLPREMLYQLAVYALAREGGNESAILYPTMAQGAKESRLEILDPDFGRTRRAVVKLRPVNMTQLARLVVGPETIEKARKRKGLARSLAGFGSSN